MYALEVVAEDGRGGVLHPLGPAATYLGRAPQNDLVVLDPTVSGRHLAVWVAEERVYAEDLGSKNGTRVGGKPITGVVQVQAGDEIVAGDLHLRVRQAEGTPPARPQASWAIEDVAAGVRYAVRADRFRIGGDRQDDIVVAGLPARAATLLFHENGEIWLGIGDDEVEVTPEQPFDVTGRSLVVRALPRTIRATVERDATRYPYALTATLHAPGGPLAEIEDVGTGAKYAFTAETRAVLLYMLACKRQSDYAAGLNDPGWCDDYDIMVGIWGRAGADAPLSKLNTLVCRVRQDLREAGFDPWFVEKRRGATRARARVVRTS